ncbi:MAG: TetR/AcrR family transcriptional regulator [Bacteroidota bacterium]
MTTKKQRIFAEAAQLFREKGYSAASMRDLAERVGLKPSSFYSHIKSKEEILQKICFDSAQKFTEGMERVEQSGGTSRQRVRALLGLHLRVALEDPTSVTVFNDEWRHLSEPALSRFVSLRKDYEHRFLRIIESGIEAGEFRAVHPQLALYTLLNALRWLHFDGKLSKQFSAESLREELEKILLHGLIVEKK